MTDPKVPAEPAETPEDVATLLSWANLHGAKYRDFSASRALARDEARKRVEEIQAAEELRRQEEADRKAQEEAQIAARLAAEAAEAARQAEAERLAEIARQAEAEHQAVLAAQLAQRQAAQQRSWQPPAPAESYPEETAYTASYPVAQPSQAPAPTFTAPAQSAPQPPAQAQRPAPQPPPAPLAPNYSAQNYGSQNQAGQSHGGPNYAGPAFANPGFVDPAIGNPNFANSGYVSSAYPPANPYPEYVAPSFPSAYPGSQQETYSSSGWQPEQRESISHPAWLTTDSFSIPPATPAIAAPSDYPQAAAQTSMPYASQVPGQYPNQNASQFSAQYLGQPQAVQPRMQNQPPSYGVGQNSNQSSSQNPAQNQGHNPTQNPGHNFDPMPGGLSPTPVDDTLLGSRDRITNRWFALKSVFDPNTVAVEQVPVQSSVRPPALAVFSLAGGVGKTSLVASLGRALSSRGEKILLVDTASFGLLPFFFGARDQRPGLLRTFNPPGVSTDAPIQLVTLDPESQASESAGQEWLMQEVSRYARGSSRIVIDLPTASGAITRRALKLAPAVLVPVVPDMNSVVSVGAIEAFFRNNNNSSGSKPTLPFYVLNQFDYSIPLHLDVREILREQIGDRLLPFALRRSPQVSEALAEGMTVMDYAPTAMVAEDYASLAGWVRSLSAPATVGYRGVRWSER